MKINNFSSPFRCSHYNTDVFRCQCSCS